jgi:hypothetical protein
MTEYPSHVYHRIAENVRNCLKIEVSATDVEEILVARTIGWPDGLVEAVQREAESYKDLIIKIPHEFGVFGEYGE